MKAACVLVCLALVHGITGSIFKQQERKVDLDDQQLDYIDQYQQRQPWDQATESLKQWDQTFQSQKNHRKQLQSQKYRNQQEQDQTYQGQEQLTQASQYQQYLPSYQEQYEQSASLNSQEWPSTHQHSHHSHHHHDKHHRNSPSSESSQESKESRYYKEQLPTLRGDKQKWNSQLLNSVMIKDNQNSQAYGDVIEWNDLRMAVGPKSPVQTPEDIEKIFGDAQKAMKHIKEEEKVKFHEVYEIAKLEVKEDAQLNATQLARKYEYLIEEYTVKTDDGYILTVFRIPPKKQIHDVQKKPVVFLMHGIAGSADDWLLMGPGKSLAYLLSDAGYDVWLGNARGNKYSRRHVTRYPAMAGFWEFSIDEIAFQDVPAMIDIALETTKQEKLYYIGHALGSTAFFALAATRPEYNNKIIMMYALSPMVYMTNVRSPLFRMIAPTSKFQERLSRQIGNEAFTPAKELIHTVGGAMCENVIGCKKVCSNVNFVMAGINVDGMDSNIIAVVMGHLPAGTSAKVIKQYGQGVASHEFRRYNYGPYINEQVYGTLEAPKFNIAEVQAPVTLYYSEEDWLAHPRDVLRLQKELPNVRETYKVPEKHFSHMDFQFSSKAPEMVYQRIIDSMQNQHDTHQTGKTKAACVLVCLALAHGITGSIFKQQDPKVDDLDDPQLDYIDQYQQRRHRDQLTESLKQRDQTFQSQKNNRKQPQSQKYRSQQEPDQTYQGQEQLTQASQYQQYLPSYQEQYEQSASLNSQEWPSTHQHSHHSHHHHDKHHRNSPSSESSQESKESRYYKEQLPTLRGDKQKWNSYLFNSDKNKDNKNSQAYDDVIEWNGLRMAVGPKSPVQTPEDIEKIFGDAQKAMKHIKKEEKVKYHEVYEVAKLEVKEDAQLNATQLARKYEYLIEEHTVMTDDGYILTVFRIPPKKQIRDVQKKPVVFLMHGIAGSADDWLLMGPGKSLAYLLSDAGYDVWLGNARGNKYSRRHVTRYPAMADFWQFSIDEIALQDVSAMIDIALETTKQEKLYYIGHALGSTAFFALAATRPEYNNKIIMMYALSPMVYMTNVRSPLFRMIAPTSKFQERLSRQIGNEAFTPAKELIHTVGGAMCENVIGCKKVCSNVNFVMAGINVDGMDSNIIAVVMGHLPAGTSAKVIKQYGQGVASHEFRRYNYGPYINEQVYGTLEAPKFNIAEVQAPVTLYYSEEDWLAHPRDVLRLQKELPNVRETYKVPEKHFSHMDFQFSSKAPEMVYQRIIESMQNQQ